MRSNQMAVDAKLHQKMTQFLSGVIDLLDVPALIDTASLFVASASSLIIVSGSILLSLFLSIA